jgi:hypothetical protein
MIYFIFAMLGLTLIRNWGYGHRFCAASVVTLVTAFSYALYHSPLYLYVYDLVGYWVYLSIAPMLSIGLLWLVRGRTAFALTVLFAGIVVTNFTCLFMGLVVNMDVLYQYLVWIAFAIQIAILMSWRITDAINDWATGFFTRIHLAGLPHHYLLRGYKQAHQ